MQIPLLHRRERPSLTISEVLHRRTDLSTFVVHLTRDSDRGTAQDNLVSIIDERRLRAGDSKGWATWDGFGLNEEALATQRVVCFSETPLEHVHSLFAEIEGRALQFRGYGVAFPKMVARWMEINPVWYVDLSRAPGAWRDWPIKEALNALVVDARDHDDFEAHPIARLTPFFEGMGSFPNENGGVRHREFFLGSVSGGTWEIWISRLGGRRPSGSALNRNSITSRVWSATTVTASILRGASSGSSATSWGWRVPK